VLALSSLRLLFHCLRQRGAARYFPRCRRSGIFEGCISVIRVLPRGWIHQRTVLARRMRPIKPAPICSTTPIIHQDPTMYSKLRRRVSSNTKA
jgi:hypothetical protein